MSLERRLFILLLCAPLLGLIGVMGAAAVPDVRIAEHLVDAERAGILGPSHPGPTPLGTTAARYTECTAFSLGLGDSGSEDLFDAAMQGMAYPGCERLVPALDEFDETGELRPGYSYFRYWHGYSVLTRPGLGIIGAAGTRWIAFAFMALVVGAMCAATKRSFGVVAAALLVVPTMLTTDVVIGSLSASSAIGTGSAWLAGWLSFRVMSGRTDWRIAALTAALAGTITAYLDLMTTMPGAYALTVVGATLGAAAGAQVVAPGGWRVTAAAAVGWPIGLAWMWASKWVIASFAVGVDAVMETVRWRIGFRLSSDSPGVSDSRLRGLTVNLSQWWDQPLTPWVVVGTLATVIVAAIRVRRGMADLGRIAVCCGLAAVPVIGWYIALNNHSQIHPLLVYRSLPIAFGAVAAVGYVALRGPRHPATIVAAGRAGASSADGHPTDTGLVDGANVRERDAEPIP